MTGKLCVCISLALLIPLVSSVLLKEKTKKKNETPSEGETLSRNCLDIHLYYGGPSGVYTIYPYDLNPDLPVQVYCDMDTDGGGWTVIQRREEKPEQKDFYQTKNKYVHGFGNLKSEFWLGLDHIHALTNQSHTEIRFDLDDFEGESRWAKYRSFYVWDDSKYYTLEVSNYTGDAGDSFSYHSGSAFTTKDFDMDRSPSNCAEMYKGGWWYRNCHYANLNGLYFDGLEWYFWHEFQSLKRTEMKIRPAY